MNLNLLAYQPQLKLLIKEGVQYIFDPVRKKNIILKPEEFVRQLVLKYFIEKKIYPVSRIAVEKNVVIDQRNKRFDILVFDTKGQPFLLVECKSFDVDISEKTIAQISIYNHKIKAPFLFVTNGQKSYLIELKGDDQDYKILTEWPQ